MTVKIYENVIYYVSTVPGTVDNQFIYPQGIIIL